MNLRGTQLTYTPEHLDQAKRMAIHDFLSAEEKPLNLKVCIIGKHGIGKTRLITNYIRHKREKANHTDSHRIKDTNKSSVNSDLDDY